MDAERKLAELWMADAPLAHDPAFAVAVLARIDRRQMWDELLDLVPVVAVLAVLAWALAPTADRLIQGDFASLGATAFLIAASVLTGVFLAIGGLRPADA